MSNVLGSAVLCLTMSLSYAQAVSKPTARENAVTAVSEAIRLLESKDYKTFLMQFVPPDRLKERGGTPEALAVLVDQFSQRADVLLATFKYARTQIPTYDDAKTTATFQLKGDGGLERLKMVKIGRYWYLGDK